MFQGSFKGVLKLQGCLKFQECFKDVSRVFKSIFYRYLKEAQRVFQGSFKADSKMFSESFKGV